jgi:Tol biopolymer transport system component
LWRQRFPDGQPEQITFGPTEEDGIAVAPDGRSLITSIGMRQGAVWIHDARGDRPLSSQGYVPNPEVTGRAGSFPRFSRDGSSLYYVKSEAPDAPTELWRVDVPSETSTKVLPGTPMLEFDISDGGREVVYSVQPRGKPSQIWLAALDRGSPPQLIAASGEDSPHFGPDGQIVVRSFDGTSYYLEQINRDGSARRKVVPYPIGNAFFMSADRRWISAFLAAPNGVVGHHAVPLTGGAPQHMCSCIVIWAPDGKRLYAFFRQPSLTDPGRTRVFPLRAGAMLPRLPLQGVRARATADDPDLDPDSYVIDAYGISPSPDPTVYAYIKMTMHWNLFRIPLPE